MSDSIVDSVVYAAAIPAESTLLRVLPDRPRRPPTFVLGPPRCGTTLVYLHLLNTYRFAYLSNLADEYPRAPVVCSAVTRWLGGFDGGYANEFGQTPGATGPSDGWNFFQRWFPTYDLATDPDPAVRDEFPSTVAGLESLFGAPFLNKNNHNSVRVGVLSELFPDARFVRVTRNPVDATLSLTSVRRRKDVTVGEWWSCPAPQFMGRSFDSHLEQAAFTVIGVERHLDRKLDSIADSRVVRTDYSDFCSDPARVTKAIEDSYRESGAQRLERRTGVRKTSFEQSTKSTPEREAAEEWILEARRALSPSE